MYISHSVNISTTDSYQIICRPSLLNLMQKKLVLHLVSPVALLQLGSNIYILPHQNFHLVGGHFTPLQNQIILILIVKASVGTCSSHGD